MPKKRCFLVIFLVLSMGKCQKKTIVLFSLMINHNYSVILFPSTDSRYFHLYWWLIFPPSTENLYFSASTDSSYYYPVSTDSLYFHSSADRLYFYPSTTYIFPFPVLTAYIFRPVVVVYIFTPVLPSNL